MTSIITLLLRQNIFQLLAKMISFFEKEEIRQILLENLCKRFPNGGCLAYGQQRLKILKVKLRNVHVLKIKAVKEKTYVKLVNKKVFNYEKT